MNLCKSHEDRLRAALDERGLAGHVLEDQTSELGMGVQADPLMSARYQIVCNALELGGAWVLIQNRDGSERCPICYLVSRAKLPEFCDCGNPECTPEGRVAGIESWIMLAAEHQRTRFSGQPSQTVH